MRRISQDRRRLLLFLFLRRTQAVLKADLALAAAEGHWAYGETTVLFDACSSVIRDQETF